MCFIHTYILLFFLIKLVFAVLLMVKILLVFFLFLHKQGHLFCIAITLLYSKLFCKSIFLFLNCLKYFFYFSNWVFDLFKLEVTSYERGCHPWHYNVRSRITKESWVLSKISGALGKVTLTDNFLIALPLLRIPNYTW